jgi:hypothetical protein
MFNYRHYIPILKGKQGEYAALATLVPSVKDCLTPLIEIPPIPWDWKKNQPLKSINGHLEEIGTTFDRAWASECPFFVDLIWISPDDRMSDGELPLEFVFGRAREWNLSPIPVTGLMRDVAYQEACRTVHARDKRGICVRVQREDFADFSEIGTEILTLLETLNVTSAESDLILDLRSIVPPQQIDADSILNFIQLLPKLSSWRSFTISATSFPQNLMGLPPEEASVIERTEWTLWLDLLPRFRELPRRPAFGDYAISHPETPEVDPRIMRPSASIRYTAEQSWLILKGSNLRDNGFEQFREVSRELLQAPEYSGSTFSWGDSYIEGCAYGRTGTGNLTTWRQVGTSHHLSFVVRQLANLYGS